MPKEMEKLLRLGAKFYPVELDIDRKQLEKDLETWYRRLRLKANFSDSEDIRTSEEKRFYNKSSWTPQAGKNFQPLITSYSSSEFNLIRGYNQGE